MNLRRHLSIATAILVTTLSCGGKTGQTAPPETESVPASTGTTGQVSGKTSPELAGAILVLNPATPRDVPVTPRPAVMDQSGQQFLPGLLLAQAGQTIQFRNSEDVLHNVRVTEVATETPTFNIATIPYGSYEHTFERTGFYTVTCDIHPTMRADIFVTPTPYFATAAADGSFTMKDVPPGAYTLSLYAGANPVVRSIEVKSGRNDVGVIQ